MGSSTNARSCICFIPIIGFEVSRAPGTQWAFQGMLVKRTKEWYVFPQGRKWMLWVPAQKHRAYETVLRPVCLPCDSVSEPARRLYFWFAVSGHGQAFPSRWSPVPPSLATKRPAGSRWCKGCRVPSTWLSAYPTCCQERPEKEEQGCPTFSSNHENNRRKDKAELPWWEGKNRINNPYK